MKMTVGLAGHLPVLALHVVTLLIKALPLLAGAQEVPGRRSLPGPRDNHGSGSDRPTPIDTMPTVTRIHQHQNRGQQRSQYRGQRNRQQQKKTASRSSLLNAGTFGRSMQEVLPCDRMALVLDVDEVLCPADLVQVGLVDAALHPYGRGWRMWCVRVFTLCLQLYGVGLF